MHFLRQAFSMFSKQPGRKKNNADVKQPELITYNLPLAKSVRANLRFELQDLKYALMRRGTLSSGVRIPPNPSVFEIHAPVI